MKIHAALVAAVLLAGCSQQPSSTEDKTATSAEDMQMSDAEHKQMASDTATASEASAPATDPASAQDMPMSDADHKKTMGDTQMASETTTAMATGTVESVDAAAGKITIAHGAVDALKWPAMTMAFKATPEQVASVKAGQKVEFEFETKGMEATITKITRE